MQQYQRLNAVIARIGKQFGKSPEERFMFAFTERVLRDAFGEADQIGQKASAIRYLQGDIKSAEICGIDSNWIKDTIRRAGLEIPAPRWMQQAIDNADSARSV